MSEEMRTFGYLCPACGGTVMGTQPVFALEASGGEVACSCGKSALRGDPYGPLPAGTAPAGGHGPGLRPDQAVLLLHRL